MSFFSRVVCSLRKAGFTLASRASPGATKPRLLCYGAVAFLWERERITNQEVMRQLKRYEARLSKSKRSSPELASDLPCLDDSVPFQSEAEKLAAEIFAKKMQFKHRLKECYETHSQSQISRYPVIGLSDARSPSRLLRSFHELLGKLVSTIDEYVLNSSDQFCDLSDGSFSMHLTESSIDIPSAFTDSGFEFKPSNEITPVLSIDQSERSIPDAIQTPIEQSSKEISKLSQTETTLTPQSPRILPHSIQEFLTQSLPTFHRFAKSFDPFIGQDAITDANLKSLANFAGKKLALRVLDNLQEFMMKERRKFEPKMDPEKSNLLCGNTFSGLSESVPSCARVEPGLNVGVWSSLSLQNGSMGMELGADNSSVSTEVEDMASWEFVTCEKHCTAYRKPHPPAGRYQYKVIGHYDDITARDFLEVQVNDEARMQWDTYAVTLTTVDSDPSTGTDVIHWIMKYPFPLSRREYVFARRSWLSETDNAIVLINRSVEHPGLPEDRKYVRVRDYYSATVIKPTSSLDELGLDFELTYFDDPQLVLPSSCVNWVASTAMPDFLDKVHAAALTRRLQREDPAHILPASL